MIAPGTGNTVTAASIDCLKREILCAPIFERTRAINIPLPSASQLIETFVKKNLVGRITNPENHRSVRITLTELGRKLTRGIVSAVDGKLRELREGPSPDEIAAFNKAVLHCFSRKNDVLK